MCSVWNEKKQNIYVYIYFLEKLACVCPKPRYGMQLGQRARPELAAATSQGSRSFPRQ